MKTIKLVIGATSILIASAFTVIKSVNWKVKDDYSVRFEGGVFKGLNAIIFFDADHPENSKISASIDARTISTGNSLMDEHAKEALGTDRYPLIRFVSIAISKTTAGYEAIGYLTMKGITKEVKLPFIFDDKNDSKTFPFIQKQTFNGKLIIVPKKFNVTRDGTPSEITIELTIPVTK